VVDLERELVMGRPPVWSAEEKLRIVMAVLRGEVSMAEAARREKVSETSVGKWRAQFLDGGREALAAGGTVGPNAAEQRLLAELDELKIALGEASAELRVLKKGGPHGSRSGSWR